MATRTVDDTWKTGCVECLYQVSDYGLELAKQYRFECEKEKETGKTSNKKAELWAKIDAVAFIENLIKNLKPGTFINNEYAPTVEGLNIIKN